MNSLRCFGLILAIFVAACTSSSPPQQCIPACRSGFVCVAGECVVGCNPPCAAGFVCTGSGATATCTATSVDAMVSDATQDGPSVMDVVNADNADVAPTDVTSTDDVLDGSDAVTAVDGSDASDVAVDAPPPCGHTGESCCYTTFCEPGNACMSGTCHTVTRAAGECSRPADCTAPQVCIGPSTCGDHGCFQCAAPPGATAFGGACANGLECATGVCRGGRCTIACDIGGTGNADCAARSPGYICAQLLYGSTSTTIVALGTCRQSCARLGDCTAPQTCIPQLNDVTNTMDFICGTSSATSPVGASCTDGSTCMSFLCLPGFGDGGSSGVCTAPCVADSDCPAAAPHCSPITWSRPDGTGQAGHGCTP